jgi:hypothetical protein
LWADAAESGKSWTSLVVMIVAHGLAISVNASVVA